MILLKRLARRALALSKNLRGASTETPVKRTYRPTFADLSETPDDRLVPALDRRRIDESRLTPRQLQWRREGVVQLPGFIPEALMNAYCKVRQQNPSPGGWECPVPYMHVPEIRDICCYAPLAAVLQELLGEPMGLHLNLTGWISTERQWHQDDYLNPDFINSWYAAVWIALDDIHPDCGPFQYVPGSHRWPVIRGERVKSLLSEEEAKHIAWPAKAERFVTPIYEREIARSGLPIKSFLGNRGDVLIWHGRLVHRGSAATQPGMLRKALISHYSAISKRVDMPNVQRLPDGGAYFLIEGWPLDFSVAPQQVGKRAG
jgi:hypothetical protein